MFIPNPKFIKYFNNPSTPAQKAVFNKITKVIMPDDICRVGGAHMAISTLVEASKRATKDFDPLRVKLPAGCFCERFDTRSGQPQLNTIRDKKYRDGITVNQLGKAFKAFAKGPEVRKAYAELHRSEANAVMSEIPEINRGSII
jgi:hypothetical protein